MRICIRSLAFIFIVLALLITPAMDYTYAAGQTNGSSCYSGSECLSGFCTDGVCCNMACPGACEACAVVSGGYVDGKCDPLPPGSIGNPSCTPFTCNGQARECPTEPQQCNDHIPCTDNIWVIYECVYPISAGQCLIDGACFNHGYINPLNGCQKCNASTNWQQQWTNIAGCSGKTTPVLDPIGNKTVNEGTLLEFNITATDADGDALTFAVLNIPTGASFDTLSGTFSWTPEYDKAGNYQIQFKVYDSTGRNDYEYIWISVGNVNGPPVLGSIGNRTVAEGQTLEIIPTATDPDGDALTYSVSNLPPGATFDPATRIFAWTPTYDQAGTYHVLFIVTDSGTPQVSDAEEIDITVGNVNNPPVLGSIGNRTVAEGQTLEIIPTATDPDGDALTYSVSNLPSGATFDPATRIFAWTPTYDQAGTYANIEFTVTDNGSPAELDFKLIAITVGNSNRAPEFTPIGTQSILENQLLHFTVGATDPDGDAMAYTAFPLPAGASFDASTRSFSWMPDGTQAGNYTVVFYATDSENLVSQIEVHITVGEYTTPCESANLIIQTVVDLNLRKSVENSYMANLKKVCKFVQDGKTTAATNQLEAFISKVRTDIVHGIISGTVGNDLIVMAKELINVLRS